MWFIVEGALLETSLKHHSYHILNWWFQHWVWNCSTLRAGRWTHHQPCLPWAEGWELCIATAAQWSGHTVMKAYGRSSTRHRVNIYQLWISFLIICSFCSKFLQLNFVVLRQAINSWFCFFLLFSSKYIHQRNRKVKGHLELKF